MVLKVREDSLIYKDEKSYSICPFVWETIKGEFLVKICKKSHFAKKVSNCDSTKWESFQIVSLINCHFPNSQDQSFRMFLNFQLLN